MLFNSLEFFLFFPIVTLLYFVVPKKFRWLHLLIASCIFYGAFIPSYLLILALLILIDYTAGLLIEKGGAPKAWLILSIVANLSLLGLFKYHDFLASNINRLTGADLVLYHWILPIGLSFHCFQSMSYTIEVYRKKQKAIRHPGYYALYVMFYPQLVAGPIERPQHLFPQLFHPQKFSVENLLMGLRLMAWGFYKKLVVADRLGIYVDGFYASDTTGGMRAILSTLFFSFQIYADFSGYSDIAIGAAKCMGIDLTINFNRPYFSKNIRSFWQRWHISLSAWFRDYVYIPLGGNKVPAGRHVFNLLFTFFLSGLWHGAGWTFIIWGLIHACYLLVYNFYSHKLKLHLPAFISVILCFVFVSFAWIFFRSKSVQQAWHIIRSCGSSYSGWQVEHISFGNFSLAISFGFILIMMLTEFYLSPRMNELNNRKTIDFIFLTLTIVLILFFGIFRNNSFIYFQF
jgi:D-alanyl-lipoteichoic acid acyltransferase DltB (MBOAT superfamily)